ncbi:MAG: TrmB family transcriptional regulator [Thermoplasmata archaeon]|nr:TrmB family transcriptional regulator [Thermoplasmata archaeon]
MPGPERIDGQFETIADELLDFGLTSYEARAYVSLVARGYGDAELIAQSAGIPRTSSYKVLSSLVDKGLVIVTGGRPRIFKPNPLEDVRTSMADRLDRVFGQLSAVHGSLSESGVPQLIYTLTGRDRVVEKIREYLETADREVILSIPKMAEFRRLYAREFQNLLARGTNVVVITSPFQKVPEGAVAIRREGILAVDLITDSENALVAAPDLSACGFTRSDVLADHLARFMLGPLSDGDARAPMHDAPATSAHDVER